MTVVPDANPSARRADLSDSDELAQLRWIWRALERGERGDQDQFRGDFVSWVAERQRTHMPFLVEANGCAVGMAWLVIIERIPGPEKWMRLSGFVQSVYVTPEHRNGGVGSLLMNTLIDAASREGLEYLSVHPSPLSFPFYRRLGFSGEGSLLFLALHPD
jgi:GNAT superfamily N-acetyltransferase